MLAGKEAQVFHLQARNQIPIFPQPAPPLVGVVGVVGEIARQYEEVRLGGEAIDCFNGLRQGGAGLGIGRSVITPVGVRELDEEEILWRRVGACLGHSEQAAGGGKSRQARGKDHSAYTSKPEKLAAACRVVHVLIILPSSGVLLRSSTERPRCARLCCLLTSQRFLV